MDYTTPQQARTMQGLRLVLSQGVPGPWGEAAKSLFHVQDVEFTPVAQTPLGSNQKLVEWLGIRNAPVAVYNDEPPRSSWLDIIMLGERIGNRASLLPQSPKLRAECIGIINELSGEWGFGWCRRLLMLHQIWTPTAGGDLSNMPSSLLPLQRQYQVYMDQISAAPDRIIEILDMLANRLGIQKRAGSPYLIGDHLSAADVYWACFSAMLKPLPHELNPMPAELRALYRDTAPNIDAQPQSILINHRNHIYRTHLRLPVDF